MIDAKRLREVVEEALEGSDKYVVEVKVSADNTIEVYVDADSSVTIDDCVSISRSVEEQFDRDVEDYNLSVLSYGLCGPLVLERQFRKYLGKNVEIKQKGHPRVVAKLVSYDADTVNVMIEKKNKKKKDSNEEQVTSLSLKEVEVRPAIEF